MAGKPTGRLSSGWVAIASNDESVRLWDRASALTAALTGHSGTVRSVAISSDSTWLAITSDDRTVRVWVRVTGTTTALTGHTGTVVTSPDGTWLATNDDGTVRVWDRGARTLAFVRSDTRRHTCRWTLDGRAIAAVGERGLQLYTFRS